MKIELSVEERYALEQRLGMPLSKQVAEHWCETKLRELIVQPEDEPELVFTGRKGKISIKLQKPQREAGPK